MEYIYSPVDFKASPHMNLKDYFQEYFKLLNIPRKNNCTDETDETEYLQEINDAMGINKLGFDFIKQLNDSCSIDHVTCDIENTLEYPTLLEHADRFARVRHGFNEKKNPHQLKVIQKKKKLEKIRCVDSLTNGNPHGFYVPIGFPEIDTPPDLKEGDDYIITIQIFKPWSFKFFPEIARNTINQMRISHEILALGRNTLAEVRDKIQCSADKGSCKEVDNTRIDLVALQKEAKEKSISGFIFIDDVFYNDTRSDKAQDYSAPIIEWAKTKHMELRAKSMEKVTVGDLQLRIGFPYVYMHQGNCEHVLVVTDARMLQNHDDLHSELYPHLHTFNRNPNKYCFFCTQAPGNWIVSESDRLPQKIVVLCTDCCQSYNYIGDQKIGNFKLYPFYENELFWR